TALAAIDRGEFDLSEPRPVHPEAWFTAMAPGSSLMFLGPDQVVDGEDLIRGLLISSGNDAATEVAYRVAGSVSRFARRMNATLAEAGFPDFYFEEPAGLSPANRITAGEFARFAAVLIREWPAIVTEHGAARSFTYPLADHYPDGIVQGDSIRQYNRNTLLTDYPGADGLKTGFIDESGYNLAATAERNGRRLIAVILGVSADSQALGGRLRAEDAARLLDWGFENYRRVAFPAARLEDVTVWGGADASVTPSVTVPRDRILPAGVVGEITREIDLFVTELWAPVRAGTEVGQVTYTAGDTVIASAPILIPESVEAGGFVTRIVDRVRWWLR
ncbi:MAG: D-alanyl-D-alanine carboxypeptidase family protein, partial [Alkalispirochaeta sp.]